MKTTRWGWCLLLGGLFLLATSTASARYYDGSRYDYCRAQAERISGYYGPVPNRYLPGGAGRGAVRGAVAGAAIGAIAGDARKGARRGAIAGAVVGAARRERARDHQRESRYFYELELDRCMDYYR